MSESVLHKILERGTFAPLTRDKYRRVIDAWLRFAGTDPKGWTRKACQDFYDDARKRTSVRTANIYIASLRYVSRWYASQEQNPLLDFAIVQTGREPYQKSAARRALTETETEQLLETCTQWSPIDRRDFALMVIGLETGMRRSSLSGCAFENIETKSYPRIKVPVKGSEGNQTWNVPLSDTCMLALENWASWLGHPKRGAIFCQLKRQISPKSSTLEHAVYRPEVGVSPQTIYTIVKQRAEQARVQDFFPHVLRHTFVSWRTLSRTPNEQIAAITGHSPDIGWKAMSMYIDLEEISKIARQTTPPWLAQLVSELVKRS